MRFAEGLGNSRDEVNNAMLMQETKALVTTFQTLSKSEQYNIVICLTENGIVNWQKHTTDIENYEHNHVLRTILNTTIGESIGNSFT